VFLQLQREKRWMVNFSRYCLTLPLKRNNEIEELRHACSSFDV
jgi:hypothetical protein